MSDKLDLYKKARARIASEMEQSEQHKDLFSRHSAHSVKLFIERYAEQQANLEVYGNFTKYQERSLIDEWQTSAWDCLEHIQQKKLVDIGFRWTAEELKDLPEIELTLDFQVVSDHILDYSGISDVTQEEVDFFIQYLRSDIDEMHIYASYALFDDFEGIRSSYAKYSTTGNEYYDYHNTYTGNHGLYSLPNIRGEKEMDYIKLADAQEDEEKKTTAAAPPKKNEKQYLDSGEDELILFARSFKQRKTASFISDYATWWKNQIDSSYKWAVAYLSCVYPEHVSISTHTSWHEALFTAAVQHKKTKIIEMLPAVYEEYLMKRNSGIQITPPNDSPEERWPWYVDRILKGRALKGEPKDFNF